MQYPGMEVKQFVSWRPCLTYSPVESVWLVAIGVNGFFVANAYVNTLFVSSIVGGMFMSTVLFPPFGDLSDEAISREADEPEYFPSMARDDLSDQDGYMADPASDVDSPRSAHMAIDDMSDGDGPMSPVSSDGRVRLTKARPNLYDLLRQIESSDDDVSQRVAQAACDSDTSGSDHAVDDEDGSDSEVSMRCKFVDSMAAESRSVQSDEGATSADSDPCETD